MCLAALPSFGQSVQWTDISYANDSLEGHKLDICLPDDSLDRHKVVILIYGSAPVVPYCQSVFFKEALESKGRLDEFVTVPRGQHGPVTFNEQTFAKMIRFFRRQAAMEK